MSTSGSTLQSVEPLSETMTSMGSVEASTLRTHSMSSALLL